jgi:hypothetical protein
VTPNPLKNPILPAMGHSLYEKAVRRFSPFFFPRSRLKSREVLVLYRKRASIEE